MGKALLAFVVVMHWVLIFGNIIAFWILPFYTSWYIALPLMSYIGLLTFSRVLDCPMTKFENRIRKNLGMPEVKGFIGHYLIRPYIRYRRSVRNKKKLAAEELSLDIQIPTMEQLAEFKSKEKKIRDSVPKDQVDIL